MLQVAVAPGRASVARSSSPRRFYTVMGVAAVLIVLLGFSGSYSDMAMGTGSLTPLVKVHALVFALWLLVFIAQTQLVAARRVRVHRRLGYAAIALAIAMVGLGYATAVQGARRGFDLSFSNDPLGYMVFPMGGLIGFAVLVTLGFLYRRRPEAHKRLMLLATIGPLMNAPLAHLFAHTAVLRDSGPVFVVLLVALASASAVYDRITRGRSHPVSLWGAILLVVWGNLQAAVIGPSAAWHQLAAWLIR